MKDFYVCDEKGLIYGKEFDSFEEAESARKILAKTIPGKNEYSFHTKCRIFGELKTSKK